MINTQALTLTEYNKLIYRLLEESEADSLTPYFDSHSPNKLVTIGRGFNIETDTNSRGLVFSEMALGVQFTGTNADALNLKEEAFVKRIVTVLTGNDTTDAQLQTALDAIMKERANDPAFSAYPKITSQTDCWVGPR